MSTEPSNSVEKRIFKDESIYIHRARQIRDAGKAEA